MFFCSVCFKKTHGEEEFKRRTMQGEKKEHGPATADAGAVPVPACVRSAEGATPSVTADQTAQPAGAAPASAKAEQAAEAKATGADSGKPAVQGETSGSGGKDDESVEPASKKMAPSRCMFCKKKVGLLGFHCRCGGTFCEKHRYSDKHECTFDYKTHGRDQVRIRSLFVAT